MKRLLLAVGLVFALAAFAVAIAGILAASMLLTGSPGGMLIPMGAAVVWATWKAAGEIIAYRSTWGHDCVGDCAPPGVSGFAAGAAADRLERYEAALRKIEALGHGEGHGFGFTCAEIAAEALGLPLKRRPHT